MNGLLWSSYNHGSEIFDAYAYDMHLSKFWSFFNLKIILNGAMYFILCIIIAITFHFSIMVSSEKLLMSGLFFC